MNATTRNRGGPPPTNERRPDDFGATRNHLEFTTRERDMATERLKSAIRFLDRDRHDYSSSESETAGMNLALSLHFDTLLAFVLVATFWGLILYAAAMSLVMR